MLVCLAGADCSIHGPNLVENTRFGKQVATAVAGGVRSTLGIGAYFRQLVIVLSRDMILAVLILAIIFGSAMIGLSMRANARLRHEKRLPMQWSLSRSKPLSETINWSAPAFLPLASLHF